MIIIIIIQEAIRKFSFNKFAILNNKFKTLMSKLTNNIRDTIARAFKLLIYSRLYSMPKKTYVQPPPRDISKFGPAIQASKCFTAARRERKRRKALSPKRDLWFSTPHPEYPSAGHSTLFLPVDFLKATLLCRGYNSWHFGGEPTKGRTSVWNTASAPCQPARKRRNRKGGKSNGGERGCAILRGV